MTNLVEVRYYIEEELHNMEVLTLEKALEIANEDERMAYPDSCHVAFSTFKDNIPLHPVLSEEGEVIELREKDD